MKTQMKNQMTTQKKQDSKAAVVGLFALALGMSAVSQSTWASEQSGVDACVDKCLRLSLRSSYDRIHLGESCQAACEDAKAFTGDRRNFKLSGVAYDRSLGRAGQMTLGKLRVGMIWSSVTISTQDGAIYDGGKEWKKSGIQAKIETAFRSDEVRALAEALEKGASLDLSRCRDVAEIEKPCVGGSKVVGQRSVYHCSVDDVVVIAPESAQDSSVSGQFASLVDDAQTKTIDCETTPPGWAKEY